MNKVTRNVDNVWITFLLHGVYADTLYVNFYLDSMLVTIAG